MTKCPVHSTELVELEEELITGKTARVSYCERCHDTYIPERELQKYSEARLLKRKLAKALSTRTDKIDVLRSNNKIIIYQTG